MEAFTPGVWRVRSPRSERVSHIITTTTNRKSICTVRCSNRDHDDQSLANAHLISAAPEMHFITTLVANIPFHDPELSDNFEVFRMEDASITMGDVRAARRALNKAQGGKT